MIGMLTGRVAALSADSIVLDVNGVGYLVGVGTGTLARLEPGQTVTPAYRDPCARGCVQTVRLPG